MAQPVDVTPANELELAIARHIEASPEQLYRAWTDPEVLPRWFAPKPLTTEIRVHEPRAGGVHFLVMKDPSGAEYPAGGVYLELTPGRRIVFTNALQGGWTPQSHELMFVGDVAFEPQPDGRTLYTARVKHWDAETARRHAEMGFHAGWGVCADQLEEVAKAL